MNNFKYFFTALLAVSLLLVGCRNEAGGTATSSKIVQDVQSSGSGDLEGVDELTMQRWLAAHADVAKRIAPECKAVGSQAAAAWAKTTEGILCAADAQVMFTMSTDIFKPY